MLGLDRQLHETVYFQSRRLRCNMSHIGEPEGPRLNNGVLEQHTWWTVVLGSCQTAMFGSPRLLLYLDYTLSWDLHRCASLLPVYVLRSWRVLCGLSCHAYDLEAGI